MPYYPAPDDGSFLDDGKKRDPGWYVNVNWDDDDKDGWHPDDHSPGATYTPDKDDTLVAGGDDDLWKFTVEIEPASIHGPIRLTFNESKVKVYGHRTKENPFASGGTVTFEGQPIALYLEGQEGTEKFREEVKLLGEYVGSTPTVEDDHVNITVFEVDLKPFFEDLQHLDCEKRHHTMNGSGDRNGRISYNDRTGDGTTGDEDPLCMSFHNCMESQGTTKPRGLKDMGFEFRFKREVHGVGWRILPGQSEWHEYPLWMKKETWHDDTDYNTQDNTPSALNHIYEIDAPGIIEYKAEDLVRVFGCHIFRERVSVKLYGTWYVCSNYLRWHHQMYVDPDPEKPGWLHRAGSSSTGPLLDWAYQKLGGNWMEIPLFPPE